MKDGALKISLARWRQWSDAEFAYALTLLFFFAALLGMLHHELWRDEAQGWLIARDARSIGQLLALTRREGHPPLWYLLLRVLSHISRDALTPQIFQLAVATGSAFVFARFAPLRRLHKALFLFGYFPLFEYGLLARSYPLGMLFLWIFCAATCATKKRSVVAFVALALLAGTSAFGVIIAVVLGVWLLISLQRDSGQSVLKWKAIVGASLFALALAATLHQIVYAGHIAKLKAALHFIEASRWAYLRLASVSIWQGYLPLPEFTNLHFWGTNWLVGDPEVFVKTGNVAITAAVFLGAVSMLAAATWALRRDRGVLLAFWSANICIMGLIFVSRGMLLSPRHYGHFFLIFIACLWLVKSRQKEALNEVDPPRWSTHLVTAWLALLTVAGVHAWAMDEYFQFSGSRLTAQYLHDNNLQNAILAGGRASTISPISVYLDRKLVYLESERRGSFVRHQRRSAFNKKETRAILRRTQRLIERYGERNDIVLIFDRPLKSSGKAVKPLWQSPESIVHDEQFFLYLVPRRQKNPA